MPSAAAGPQAHHRVIVVDDHLVSADLLAEYLRMTGYDAAVTPDGNTALAWAEAAPPECVLLDMHMPEVDGLELGRRLRERYGRQVMIVTITGHANDPQSQQLRAISDHFFEKPVDLRQLEQVLPPVWNGSSGFAAL